MTKQSHRRTLFLERAVAHCFCEDDVCAKGDSPPYLSVVTPPKVYVNGGNNTGSVEISDGFAQLSSITPSPPGHRVRVGTHRKQVLLPPRGITEDQCYVL